jgi:hypothetical protein
MTTLVQFHSGVHQLGYMAQQSKVKLAIHVATYCADPSFQRGIPSGTSCAASGMPLTLLLRGHKAVKTTAHPVCGSTSLMTT